MKTFPDDRISHLQLPDAGDDEQPQIYGLRQENGGWSLTRRSLLGAAAAACGSPTPAAMLQAETNKKVECKQVYAHEDWVKALAFSPDGKLLVSGSRDRTIKLWSMPDGALRATLSEHTDDVHALAVSSDSATLASGSWDQTVKLWKLPEGARHRSGISRHEARARARRSQKSW